MIITDPHLNELARFETIVGYSELYKDRIKWSEVAWNMHQKSGLFEKWNSTPFNWAFMHALDFIRDYAGPKPILAGNSVHFDRRFLTTNIPELQDILHHRILDVSFFKVLRDIWNMGSIYPGKVEPAHTAIKDVEESLASFRTHAKLSFKPDFLPEVLR